MLRIAFLVSLLALGAMAAAYLPVTGRSSVAPTVSYAERMGTRYTPLPKDVMAAPRLTEVPIPPFDGIDAIWGSTGRDAAGHVWLGVSAQGDGKSAHLLEYAPDTGMLVDRGDVVRELEYAGLHRNGEGQIKVHTKIIQAEDGNLYFASFDEEGESDRLGLDPKWGGHLWRLRPDGRHWEHLHSVPKGLVAVAGNGPWIYALGYWGHILYQYDTRKGGWREASVGSVRGHVSRNIVADRYGHVYVPRVREWMPDEAAQHPDELFSAELVEFDTDLKERASTPLHYYADPRVGRDSHGLIGLTYLADGSIVVSTHVGYLYRIVPSENAAAKVEPLGWLHPSGQSYPSAMFPVDGERYVVAVAAVGRGQFDWVVYDLMTRTAQAQKLPYEGNIQLLYGSSTRDDAGRFYIVGRQRVDGRGNRPILLQAEIPE